MDSVTSPMDMALTQTRKGNRTLDIIYDDEMIVYLVEEEGFRRIGRGGG